jgi:hypothetical protein
MNKKYLPHKNIVQVKVFKRPCKKVNTPQRKPSIELHSLKKAQLEGT